MELLKISVKGETNWSVGPCDKKVDKSIESNLSILTNPRNQGKIQSEPLPYIVEPIPYSTEASSHFQMMPESIARDVFVEKKTKKSDKEILNHSVENFILDTVLPIPMAGCLTQIAIDNYDGERIISHVSRRCVEHYTVLTGSFSDGLCLPEVTHMNREIKVTEGPDEDNIYIFSSLIVNSENRRAFCWLDTSKSPPGYTKLIFNKAWLEKRPSKYPRERVEERLIREKYPDFVSSKENDVVVRRKLVSILRKYLKREIRSRDKASLSLRSARSTVSSPNINFSCHGPAVTCELARTDFLKVTISNDNVVALPCPLWPDEAAEWIKRERVWPPKSLVRFIIKTGCHIVPKGDKYHNDPHDFLFSFSYCEKLIALSLSIKQKRCYMLFKFLFKYSINKVCRGLTTYHCKTIFFRLCEQIHEDQWSETHPFELLMRLLHQMKNCLQTGILPMYFMPKRNMIDFMTCTIREVVLKDVNKVIENPVGIFLKLTDKHRFCWFSQDISASDVFTPLLINQQLTRNLAQQTLLTYMSSLLDKGEVGFVLSLLCGTEICDEVPSIDIAIHYVEKAVESNRGSECINVKALLGTLYHQQACSTSFGSLHRRRFIRKSLAIFNQILQDENCSAWIIGEYYNLLFNLQDFDKLINHYTTVVRSDYHPTAEEFFKGGIYTIVDFHNRRTVDEPIQASPEFIVPSILYVSYKAITASMGFVGQDNLDERDVITIIQFGKRIVQKLQQWLLSKQRLYPEYIDEYANIILGLCYRHLDDIEKYKKQLNVAEDFSDALRQKGSDCVYIEPVTVRIHHRFKSYRHNPYPPRSKRKKSKVPDLSFRLRDFIVHEYKHY